MKYTCICNGRDKAVIRMAHVIYGEIDRLLLIVESDGEHGRNFAKFFTCCRSVMKAELPAKTLWH